MREFAEGLAGEESCDASRMSFVIDHEFLRDCGWFSDRNELEAAQKFLEQAAIENLVMISTTLHYICPNAV